MYQSGEIGRMWEVAKQTHLQFNMVRASKRTSNAPLGACLMSVDVCACHMRSVVQHAVATTTLCAPGTRWAR